MKIKINKVEDFNKLINELINVIINNPSKGATIISLNGDLGSGKTTFVKIFAEFLNIKESVVSPTFTISKEYKIKNNKDLDFNKLIHIDAYRLKDEVDLKFIGFNEQVKDNKNIIFIEWMDIVKKGIPKKYIEIKFKYIDKNSREVEI